MGAFLIAANIDKFWLNFLTDEHPLITRAVNEDARAEVVSIVVYHELWNAALNLVKEELDELRVSIVQKFLQEFASCLIDS